MQLAQLAAGVQPLPIKIDQITATLPCSLKKQTIQLLANKILADSPLTCVV